MTFLATKPILYTRRQVALMVAVAAHVDAEFRNRVEEEDLVWLMEYCELKPKRAILEFFNLRRAKGGLYAWNPR
jgi:hypothetical protein